MERKKRSGRVSQPLAWCAGVALGLLCLAMTPTTSEARGGQGRAGGYGELASSQTRSRIGSGNDDGTYQGQRSQRFNQSGYQQRTGQGRSGEKGQGQRLRDGSGYGNRSLDCGALGSNENRGMTQRRSGRSSMDNGSVGYGNKGGYRGSGQGRGASRLRQSGSGGGYGTGYSGYGSGLFFE